MLRPLLVGMAIPAHDGLEWDRMPMLKICKFRSRPGRGESDPTLSARVFP